MNKKFEKMVNRLPILMNEILSSEELDRNNLSKLFEKGVYIFFENKKPIYVGRSNRLKHRLLEHSRPSSSHNSAPFAFNIAKKNAKNIGIDINISRNSLIINPDFNRIFISAKERVSKMNIKVIEINDPIVQTIFEVYASIELNTEYNEFDTH